MAQNFRVHFTLPDGEHGTRDLPAKKPEDARNSVVRSFASHDVDIIVKKVKVLA